MPPIAARLKARAISGANESSLLLLCANRSCPRLRRPFQQRPFVDFEGQGEMICCSATKLCATRLRRFRKAFIQLFFVGEQLLDARAFLHAFEMRNDVGKT